MLKILILQFNDTVFEIKVYHLYFWEFHRPKWNESTTPAELDAAERESFLSWRRQLAEIQEIEDLVITPFEKNLEFWRQLWRVVERR